MAQEVGGGLGIAAGRGARVALLVAASIVGVTTLLPIAQISAALELSSFAQWTNPRLALLFLKTLGLAAAVAAVAVGIGVPVGIALGRLQLRARALWCALHALPAFLPPLLPALGWFELFGRNGWLGSEASAAALFGPIGVVLVLALCFAPFVSALVFFGARNLDAAIEEAALVSAPPGRVLKQIVLPALAPEIVVGATIAFALTLTELGVPTLLRTDVYASAVFARLGTVSRVESDAAALVLPLVLVGIGLAVIEQRQLSRRLSAVARPRVARRPLAFGRAPLILAIAASVLSIVPLVALFAKSFRAIPELRIWVGSSIESSLVMAFSATVIVVPTMLVIGHALARGSRAARAIDAVSAFAFYVPASVLGIGLIGLWNRPATSGIYASGAIVALALAARYAVIGSRAFATSVQMIPIHAEDAARVSGAGYFRGVRTIVAPLGRHGLVAGSGLVLVFCLRDLDTAILCYAAGREPLTVRIFTLEANGPPAVISALALVQIAITSAVLAIVAWSAGAKRA